MLSRNCGFVGGEEVDALSAPREGEVPLLMIRGAESKSGTCLHLYGQESSGAADVKAVGGLDSMSRPPAWLSGAVYLCGKLADAHKHVNVAHAEE